MSTANKVEDLKKKILPGMRERCMVLMEQRVQGYRKEKGMSEAMECILETVAYEFACFTVAGIDATRNAP